MGREPEHAQPELPRPLCGRLKERPADAGAATVAAHGEANDLGAVPPVLGVRAHHLHGADDGTVLERREQHATVRVETPRGVEPRLARVLACQRPRETERHVRRMRVEQQLRQLVRGCPHLVGRELRNLHDGNI